jgi:hypothetical protein
MIESQSPSLILVPKYSQRIVAASLLTMLPMIVSLWNNLFDYAFVCCLILFSSINYWRYPIKCWRRTFDIICVALAICYQSYKLLSTFQFAYNFWYFLSLACGGYCYKRAKQSSANQNESSQWHVFIHVFGNIGNVVLIKARLDQAE